MKIESLIGTQQIDPVPCPSCGHRFEQYSGVPGGTVSKIEPGRGSLLLMVCEGCETVVARHGQLMLALTREQEQQLPAEATATIAQARQGVQARKRGPSSH